MLGGLVTDHFRRSMVVFFASRFLESDDFPLTNDALAKIFWIQLSMSFGETSDLNCGVKVTSETVGIDETLCFLFKLIMRYILRRLSLLV